MNKQKIRNEEIGEVNIKRLLDAVLRRAWIVIMAAVVSAAIIFAGTYLFVTPLYQATAMFYVNNGSISVGDTSVRISSGDITASKSLVDTYIVILNTRETLNAVIDYGDIDRGYSELRDMIQAEAVNETEIFKVVVTSPSPNEAEKIANSIADILPERISDIVEGTSAKVVDSAVTPLEPSSPSFINNTLLGFLLGMVLSVGIIAVRELFNISIRSEEDITQICKHPVLAAIPDMAVSEKGGNHYGYSSDRKKKQTMPRGQAPIIGNDISFAASEAYKLLRTNLQYSFADEKDCRVIGISSAISGEGKSISAINLAYSLSQLKKRVILIDCDMRKPTVAEKLNIQKKPGLSGLLTGQCNIAESVQTCRMEGNEKAFYVIAAGQNPPNPVELLSSTKLSVILQAIRQNFDYVILDLPPVCEVSDALAVKQEMDGMLFVVRQNRCNRMALKDAVQRFEYVNAKILGIIYNSVDAGSGKYGYGNRYYKRYDKRYENSYAEAMRRDKQKKGK